MTTRAHPDATIARLARDQYGLFTKKQATAAGLTSGQLRHRVQTGALAAVAPGVYAIQGVPPSWEQRAMRALLIVGDGTVLCRRSAATVWELELPRTSRIEVASTGRRGWYANSAQLVVHRVRHLDTPDRGHAKGLAVTTLPRTIVDLASCIDDADLTRVVDDVLARRSLTPKRLHVEVGRLSRPGRRGLSTLRDVLDPWLRGVPFDSVAEASCWRALQRAGLPAPVRQFPVMLPGKREVRIDFAWPARLVALEVDGYRWHADPKSHARDSARATALDAAGWTVLRTTPTELTQSPGPLMEALRRRLLSTA